ncbi:MAG: heme exporter protein CcmD [Stappiaceae bacterium]
MSSDLFNLSTHDGFVLASYLISFVVILGLTISIRLDGSRQQKILDELEAQGIKTRRDGSAQSKRGTS